MIATSWTAIMISTGASQGEQPNQDWATPGRLFFCRSVFYHGAHAGPSLEGAR